jgi:cobalamin biosynthesis Mg chelatase CobN
VRRLLCTLVLAGLLLPAAASAAPGGKTTYLIFSDYTKKGSIEPCKYTTAELEAALDAVTPDIKQYASDYPGAIKDAISSRASGACDQAAPAGGAPATPSTSAPTPAPTPVATPAQTATTQTVIGDPPSPPGPASAPNPVQGAPEAVLEQAATTAPHNDTPAPLIGLGLVVVLLALTALMLIAMRRLGAGEGRLAPAYHSWREARWRAGGVWEDFRDWLRIGR